MNKKFLAGCALPVLVAAALVTVLIINGPALVGKVLEIAENKIEEAGSEINRFNETSAAFLQDQIDTQRTFSPSWFAPEFLSKTSEEDWQKAMFDLTRQLGDLQQCSVTNQSFHMGSFSSDFEISYGSDRIILGSNSKGPSTGNKAMTQCRAEYLHGTTTETYYWGKGKTDTTYTLWRIEISDITPLPRTEAAPE